MAEAPLFYIKTICLYPILNFIPGLFIMANIETVSFCSQIADASAKGLYTFTVHVNTVDFRTPVKLTDVEICIIRETPTKFLTIVERAHSEITGERSPGCAMDP